MRRQCEDQYLSCCQETGRLGEEDQHEDGEEDVVPEPLPELYSPVNMHGLEDISEDPNKNHDLLSLNVLPGIPGRDRALHCFNQLIFE